MTIKIKNKLNKNNQIYNIIINKDKRIKKNKDLIMTRKTKKLKVMKPLFLILIIAFFLNFIILSNANEDINKNNLENFVREFIYINSNKENNLKNNLENNNNYNKTKFFVNEEIKIELNIELNDSINLKITSPTHFYNFLGINNEIFFIPNEKGNYYIELFNENNLIESKKFYVEDFNSDELNNKERENVLDKKLDNEVDIQKDNLSTNNLFNEILIKKDLNNIILKLFKPLVKIVVKKKYKINEDVLIYISKNISNINYYNINYITNSYNMDLNELKLVIKSINLESKRELYKEYNLDKNNIILKPEYIGKYELFLYDSFGNLLDSNIFFVVEEKNFKVINSYGKEIKGKFFYENKEINISNTNFLDDVDYIPEIKNIKKIKFKELNLDNSIDFGLQDLEPEKLDRNFIKAYAINPENLDFKEALVTSVASGKTLYKCAEWNFLEQKCYGVWKKIMTLTPGKEYNLVLTKNDPAYAESDSIPEPKPLTGFIFMSDNSRANNGIPVKIFNNANSESILTYVYAPPIPQYKGAYSANIYGITGDSITVKAWNSTHYGETNATLLQTTTYVNVTIQYLKGSEPNVSIIYPINNTNINLSDYFNVSAKINILNANGINCYVSVLSSLSSLIPGEENTIYLGNISVNNEVSFMWNLTAIKGGSENIIVNASCESDTILEALNIAKTNITIIDNVNPEITIFYPLENYEVTNPAKFIFNVSDHTGIENCSLLIDNIINLTILSPEMYIQHSFNLTMQAGKYNFSIECYDNSTLYNYNISYPINFYLPSWHFYYGNISSKIFLGVEDIEKYTWESYSIVYLYVTETNTIVDWNNLQALGRNKYNLSEFDDFYEADLNLSMENFIDSINNTFTENNLPKKTINLTLFSRKINNIPIINSTNSSDFITGILWDMSNSDSYNGSQSLIFFTNKSIAKKGKFGYYEYEIRIPANLKNYKLNSGSITFFTEII